MLLLQSVCSKEIKAKLYLTEFENVEFFLNEFIDSCLCDLESEEGDDFKGSRRNLK
jgi:hypothetical protein